VRYERGEAAVFAEETGQECLPDRAKLFFWLIESLAVETTLFADVGSFPGKGDVPQLS
jgi:hypothetical protein